MTTGEKFRLTPDQLRGVIFFDDAVELLDEMGAVSESELAELTGFGVLPGVRKSELVGQPFLILEYQVRPGLRGVKGAQFSELLLITTDNRKYILRDSSLGIHAQLKEVSADRAARDLSPNMNIYVRKGLYFDEYPYDDKGVTRSVRTYYLDL